MDAQELLQALRELTEKNRQQAIQFLGLKDEELLTRIRPESWNILECLEHLNRYGALYIPEIGNRIQASKYKRSESFRSSWLGNYFAESMLPKEKLNKMQTFKSMNPINADLDRTVIDTFIDQQGKLLDLLKLAATTNLTKVKTAISITRWIKLRLGDTFRVVIYHNLRHIVQAEKVLIDLKSGKEREKAEV
ncbi:MAG: DinB family protein [Bacteroidota bacterium]